LKRKHISLLIALCLAALGGLGVAWYLGVPLSTLAVVAMLLICPLSHFFMMRGGHGHSHGMSAQKTEDAKQ